MALADVISTVDAPARRLADVLISVVHPHAHTQQAPQQGPAQPPTAPPAQPAWYTEGFRTVRAEAKAKGEAATRAEEAAVRAEKVAGAGAERSLQSDELYGHGVDLTKQVEEELKKPQPDMAKVRNLQQLAEIAFSGSIGYAPRAGSGLSGGRWETLSPNVPGDKTASTTDFFGQPIDPGVRYDRKRNPVTDEVGWFPTYAKPLPDRPAMETTETRTGTDAFGFPSTSTTRRVTGPVGAPVVARTAAKSPATAPSGAKAKPVAAPSVKVESGTPVIKRSPQVEALIDAAVDTAVATKKMPGGKLGMAVGERMKERGIAIPTPDTAETRKLAGDVRRTQVNLQNAELGAQRQDNPGDYLLVENFMQLSYGVDPKAMRGSGNWFAKIQEFAGGSLPQRLVGEMASVSGGGLLSPASRASLLKLVRDMAAVRLKADQTGTANSAPAAAEDAQKGADAIDAALSKKK